MFGRRVRWDAEEARTGQPRRRSGATGRDKSVWAPDVITLEGSPQWRAVGDPSMVRAWLERVRHIGAKQARGQGAVTGWTVTDEGSLDADVSTRRVQALEWVTTDGFARPVRLSTARAILGVPEDAATIAYHARPPYLRREGSHGRAKVLTP